MLKSEQINELAQALSKFQGDVEDVGKDKKGYGYSYADLSSVLELSRPLLAKHGLSVSQVTSSASDKVVLETILMHTSGQWLSGSLEMSVERGKGMSAAQAVGSVITYARRYALTALLGIAQKDDDAHVAEKDSPKGPQKGPQEGSPSAGSRVAEIGKIMSLVSETNTDFKVALNHYRVNNIEDMDPNTMADFKRNLEIKAAKMYSESRS